MTKRIRQIAAVLRDSAGAKLPICLKVTTLALSDSATVVDEAVVEVSLASGKYSRWQRRFLNTGAWGHSVVPFESNTVP